LAASVSPELELGEEPQTVHLHLTRGHRIAGKVIDSEGRPVSGMTVAAVLDDGPASWPIIGHNALDRRTVTDASGRFRLGPMPKVDHIVGPVSRTRGVPEPRRVRPPKGELVFAVPEAGFSIHGVVRADGEPVSSAMVGSSGDCGERMVRPGAGGAFRLTALRPGQCQVFAVGGELQEVRDVVVGPEAEKRLDIFAVGASVEVRMSGPDNLVGQLVVAGTRMPTSVKKRDALDTSPAPNSRSSPGLPFTFKRVPPGDYDVYASEFPDGELRKVGSLTHGTTDTVVTFGD